MNDLNRKIDKLNFALTVSEFFLFRFYMKVNFENLVKVLYKHKQLLPYQMINDFAL
jgi:hypothetical protein